MSDLALCPICGRILSLDVTWEITHTAAPDKDGGFDLKEISDAASTNIFGWLCDDAITDMQGYCGKHGCFEIEVDETDWPRARITAVKPKKGK